MCNYFHAIAHRPRPHALRTRAKCGWTIVTRNCCGIRATSLISSILVWVNYILINLDGEWLRVSTFSVTSTRITIYLYFVIYVLTFLYGLFFVVFFYMWVCVCVSDDFWPTENYTRAIRSPIQEFERVSCINFREVYSNETDSWPDDFLYFKNTTVTQW